MLPAIFSILLYIFPAFYAILLLILKNTEVLKMAITIIDQNTFEATVGCGKLVVVDFFATWCGPCKALAPILEEVSEEVNPEEILFAKLDIDQNVALARKYGVMSVPTMVAFKDGKAIVKMIGLHPKEDVLNLIEEAKKRI